MKELPFLFFLLKKKKLAANVGPRLIAVVMCSLLICKEQIYRLKMDVRASAFILTAGFLFACIVNVATGQS